MEMIDNMVSIIIPVYKVENYVARTIQSILNQTYSNWELLLVDDCSPDASAVVISEYTKKDNRIKYFKQAYNQGAAAARNRGLLEAKGQYVAFLDADDMWDEKKLESQLQLMKEKNCGFSYCALRMVDVNDKVIKQIIPVPSIVTYKTLLKRTVIATSTVVVDRKIAGEFKIPRIDKVLGGEDYEAWLMLLKRMEYAVGIQQPMFSYRDTPNSLSSNKVKGLKKVYVIQRRFEKIGVIQAAYNTFCFGVYAFKKHFL